MRNWRICRTLRAKYEQLNKITISVKEAEVDQTGNFTTYLILG